MDYNSSGLICIHDYIFEQYTLYAHADIIMVNGIMLFAGNVVETLTTYHIPIKIFSVGSFILYSCISIQLVLFVFALRPGEKNQPTSGKCLILCYDA